MSKIEKVVFTVMGAAVLVGAFICGGFYFHEDAVSEGIKQGKDEQIKITQKDLDDVMKNWVNNVSGDEINRLEYGYPTGDTEKVFFIITTRAGHRLYFQDGLMHEITTLRQP